MKSGLVGLRGNSEAAKLAIGMCHELRSSESWFWDRLGRRAPYLRQRQVLRNGQQLGRDEGGALVLGRRLWGRWLGAEGLQLRHVSCRAQLSRGWVLRGGGTQYKVPIITPYSVLILTRASAAPGRDFAGHLRHIAPKSRPQSGLFSSLAGGGLVARRVITWTAQAWHVLHTGTCAWACTPYTTVPCMFAPSVDGTARGSRQRLAWLAITS